jgi:hypothetical protein
VSRRFVNVSCVYAGGSTVWIVAWWIWSGKAAGIETVLGRVIERSQSLPRTPLLVMQCWLLRAGSAFAIVAKRDLP